MAVQTPKKSSAPLPWPALVPLGHHAGKPPISLQKMVILVGRRATCDVTLIEASVSTAHAVIFHLGGVRYIRDLGSRTGTYVNGAKVHQQELSPGDSIRIGETTMEYALATEHDHAIAP